MRGMMRTVMAAGLVLAAQGARAEPEPDLAALRWQARPLLVFAQEPADPRYVAQMAQLSEAGAALRARDMVLFGDAAPERQGALRARFAPEGFLLVLIGKDGGVKLATEEVTPPEALFALVDAMPMRRREMRQQE